MQIRDTIHGDIKLNDIEDKIVDTKEMQHLRYIKQLDTTYLIFPGANHTRFEHSLGTMQVTKEISKNIYGDNGNEFSYVGLLHDVGHGPFSHLSENLTEKYLKKNHEQLGEDIIRNSEIKDILSNSTLSFDRIMSYFKDPEKIDVVGGTLGSDRIDYLMRDSHYTGVAYGIIDYDRLKTRLLLYKDKVSISEQGISGAESMLIARYFMFHNVYAHHAKTIANKMIVKAIEIALENDVFDAKTLSRMSDEELVYSLENSNTKKSVELIKRIKERNFFKRSYYNKVKKDVDIEKLSDEIVDSGIEKDEFIVHQMNFGAKNDDVDVVDPDGTYIGKLTEVSPFVHTLMEVNKTSKKLLVACDKSNILKINSIVKDFVE